MTERRKRLRMDEDGSSVAVASGSSDADNGINPYNNKPYSRRYYEILEKRRALPVWQFRQKFLDMALANQVCVLVGETGSGEPH